jgi:hypothetical protein
MTVWNDGNLRYLGYVCTAHEVVPDGDQGSGAAPPRLDAVFNYGPFASCAIVLRTSNLCFLFPLLWCPWLLVASETHRVLCSTPPPTAQ